MPMSQFIVENRTSKPMKFHIEPECIPFEIPVGKSVEISGIYHSEPFTIQFSDDSEYGMFGSLYPGDGSIVITVSGGGVAQTSL